MTVQELQAALDALDDGVLLKGAHPAGGRQFCVLEFESQVRGRSWSDTPITLPDLRPLNDGPWSSNEVRTAALLPVMAALWQWSTWTSKQRQQWTTSVVLDTVREIVSQLPGLPLTLRKDCQAITTLSGAAQAAVAAAESAGSVDLILQTACTIWIRAARQVEGPEQAS